ncbi:hypothetical protein FHG87_010692 [Trinorchestia longiramus]|nr:hypothetical protein FHG87_010692 [Trinorchestia longiramus]
MLDIRPLYNVLDKPYIDEKPSRNSKSEIERYKNKERKKVTRSYTNKEREREREKKIEICRYRDKERERERERETWIGGGWDRGDGGITSMMQRTIGLKPAGVLSCLCPYGPSTRFPGNSLIEASKVCS